VTISLEKIILRREKGHCTILYSSAHTLCVGLWLGLGLSWVAKVRVGVRI